MLRTLSRSGRRQRQAFALHLQVQRIGVGQGVDTQQLHGHVVVGTTRLGSADMTPRTNSVSMPAAPWAA